MKLSKIHREHFIQRMIVLVLTLMMICAAGTRNVAAAQTVDQPQLLSGPVLLVTDYTVVEGDRGLGSSFVLKMNIANLSELATAHNVVATLTIENTSVSLQEGYTNQQFFRKIQPGETVSLQFPLEVYSYCAEENMILSVTMACHDDFAVHYDFQTMMTPDIDVARTLQVASLAVPQFVHQNSNMIISATISNPEVVTLNNIRMHVITQYGEEVTEVGKLLREERKTVDCIFRFPEQKTEDVQVYFTYESLYGQEFSTEPESFQVIVYGQGEEGALEGSGELGGKEMLRRLVRGIPLPGTDLKIPIPAVVLLLVGFGGYCRVMYVALRRRKEE